MICSGVYDGRNYCVDLSTIKPVKFEDLEWGKPVIYGISGVWTNVATDSSLYLGSAFDEKDRLINEHLLDLKNNNHFNLHLQRVYNKHSVQNFVFFRIEEFSKHIDRNYLFLREQNWLDYYNSSFNHKVLYNISEIATGTDAMAKEFIIVYPNGQESKIRNLSKFCRENGLKASCMSEVASGNWEFHKGFKCRYVNEEYKPFKRAVCGNGYIITYPNGNIEIIKNLRRFCSKTNLCYSSMVHLASGDIPCYRNYRIKRIEPYENINHSGMIRRYCITFPDGRVSMISNLKQFCIENKLNRSSMRRIIKTGKIYNGFKCEYTN